MKRRNTTLSICQKKSLSLAGRIFYKIVPVFETVLIGDTYTVSDICRVDPTQGKRGKKK